MYTERCAVYSSKQLSGLQAGEYSCMCANMHTLPVYALKFELLKFQQLLKHRGDKFNICGLDHYASEPFIYVNVYTEKFQCHYSVA